MTGDTGLPARRAALEALAAVDERDAYSTLTVPDAVADLPAARDRAFASHLAYDTLRWEGTLDWALSQVLDRDLDDVERPLRRLLRLGALQIMRTDVPARAAVDTTVRLAREAVPAARAGGAAGFVNGVLRALARRDDLPWPDRGSDPVGHLALTTAHPRWIVSELVDRLGADEAERALVADNDPPGVTLRAVGDHAALVAELCEAGLDAAPGEHAPEAVRVPGADPRRVPAVGEGRAVVQDEASMVVAHAVDPAPGERIVDLCAGPGGKATHLAELAAPGGTVIANELHHHRAQLVAELADHVGAAVRTVVGDGTRPPLGAQTADAVLVDAPCTGLGTGRRRPEARWRRSRSDAVGLAALQVELVVGGARLVRPGGRLVYAACTWTREETAAVTRDSLDRLDGAFAAESERQLWPHRDGTDGMYIAVLRRGRYPA